VPVLEVAEGVAATAAAAGAPTPVAAPPREAAVALAVEPSLPALAAEVAARAVAKTLLAPDEEDAPAVVPDPARPAPATEAAFAPVAEAPRAAPVRAAPTLATVARLETAPVAKPTAAAEPSRPAPIEEEEPAPVSRGPAAAEEEVPVPVRAPTRAAPVALSVPRGLALVEEAAPVEEVDALAKSAFAVPAAPVPPTAPARPTAPSALVPSTRAGPPGSEAPNSTSGSSSSPDADADSVGMSAVSGRASGTEEFEGAAMDGGAGTSPPRSSKAPCDSKSSSESITLFSFEAADDAEFDGGGAVEEVRPDGVPIPPNPIGSSTGRSAKGSKVGREAASIVFEPESRRSILNVSCNAEPGRPRRWLTDRQDRPHVVTYITLCRSFLTSPALQKSDGQSSIFPSDQVQSGQSPPPLR
jgi:hypothetical protein